MEKAHFEALIESVKEMKMIQKGKQRPARVTKVAPVQIKAIREKLGQSQSEFAFMIGVSPSTLRNWEQGTRHPAGPAIALLRVAQKDPKAVYKALHSC